MRTMLFDRRAFAQIVKEKQIAFSTTEEFVDLADEHGLWTEYFDDHGKELLKKSIMRSVLRQKYKDEDGEPVEWVNIIQADKRGRRRQVYKPLGLLDVDDFEHVIRDRMRRVDVFTEELHRFCNLAYKQFGQKIQKRFDFDLKIGG